MVYIVRSLNYSKAAYYYARATHVLQISYNLSTQNYITLQLHYDMIHYLVDSYRINDYIQAHVSFT